VGIDGRGCREGVDERRRREESVGKSQNLDGVLADRAGRWE
jgi:hypothetical protein